uniref:Uncharacterized protein n=1 Tax=Oryza meridionalis TaxID=40149 RepID=A0A0E0CNQ7_9ORYZ
MFTPPPSAISSCHSESKGPKGHNDIDRQLTEKLAIDGVPTCWAISEDDVDGRPLISLHGCAREDH